MTKEEQMIRDLIKLGELNHKFLFHVSRDEYKEAERVFREMMKLDPYKLEELK